MNFASGVVTLKNNLSHQLRRFATMNVRNASPNIGTVWYAELETNPDALSFLPGDACRHNAHAAPLFSGTDITTCSRGAACNFKRNQSTDSPRSRAMIVRSVVEKNQCFSGRILCLSVFLSFCLWSFVFLSLFSADLLFCLSPSPLTDAERFS